jgi:hypothetical protein
MIPSYSFAQADIGAGSAESWPADTEIEVAYNSIELKSKFSRHMSMLKHNYIVTTLPGFRRWYS